MKLIVFFIVCFIQFVVIDSFMFLFCKPFNWFGKRMRGDKYCCPSDLCIKRKGCIYWYKNRYKSQSKTSAEPETHPQDASAD